jgi:diacylglycerol kinase (ATP)
MHGPWRARQRVPARRWWLLLVLFDRIGPGAALLYGAALPLDLLGRAPGVRHLRARRIDFVGNETVPAQADGEAAGYTPLSVTDAPAPIHVVVG